ncbi:MAG: adenylosuccinate synthetase [Candidatus Methanomethylicota archaeon]|uniref:Adenylosuccinate synthetase n=2 Tax=Thermoproteota archaeon TaxID=2056631 RepID=A0A497EXJ0_9CREN|nr:MAG: adenylosuccinate synthetase [Candidatus Verstraetearchaeota archaeon]
MPCMVIVGGFFGDEGKGKVVSYLAIKDKVDLAVRTGSVNAGHTVLWKGRKYKLRIIPSAFVYEKCRLLVGAGANVNVQIFLKEIEETNCKNRVGVDFQASIIEEKHIAEDRGDAHLAKKIGTTGQGVGPAIAERVRRKAKLARDIPELKPYLTDVALEVNEVIDRGGKVILEGTQGTFLSLYHGTYPYVTGRDTTAPAVCSEVGVGPTKVDDVLIVFKAYVTRVGAGPLPGELSPEEADRRGWTEIATVTGRRRRAAPFNFELARRAAMLNGATQIAITKLDILFPNCAKAREYDQLSEEAKKFISEVEEKVGVPVTIIGTGEDVYDTIDLREKKMKKK